MSPSSPLPPASLLPSNLVAGYRTWLASKFQPNKAGYAKLAKAQTPQALVISCCDSRVNALSLFSASDGAFFVHRNIANLVPPYTRAGSHQGTAAAIEYAVQVLRVPHILVIGHAGCGGIAAGFDACQTETAQEKLQEELPYVSGWLEMLKEVYDRLPALHKKPPTQEMLTAFEQMSVVNSLGNLAQYPFVAEAMNDGRLQVSGLWHDIGTGRLYVYDSASQKFQAV